MMIRPMVPKNRPTTISPNRRTNRLSGEDGKGGRTPAITGVISRVMAPAKSSRKRGDTYLSPNPGIIIITEPIRANTRKKANRSAGNSSWSIYPPPETMRAASCFANTVKVRNM